MALPVHTRHRLMDGDLIILGNGGVDGLVGELQGVDLSAFTHASCRIQVYSIQVWHGKSNHALFLCRYIDLSLVLFTLRS